MTTILYIAATTIGAGVIAWYAFWFLAEFLRAFYWAIWTLIPEARANRDRATVRRVMRHLFYQTWDEFSGSYHYTEKSSRYWRHGYWPWEKNRSWN